MAWYSFFTNLFSQSNDEPTWENTNKPAAKPAARITSAPSPTMTTTKYKPPTPYDMAEIMRRIASQQAPVRNQWGGFQTPPQGRQYDDLFSRYSHLYRLPPGLLSAIAYKETGGTYRANQSSGRGARGLMQLMPPHWNGTYGKVWAASGTPPPVIYFNPDNPNNSVQHAAWYISTILWPRFRDWKKVIAAYNVGETAVANAARRNPAGWLSMMPYETRDYVAKVGQQYTGLV